MIRAYLLSTGKDGNTFIQAGFIDLAKASAVLSIQFKEDPPQSSSAFHNAPTSQFVLSLTGVMEVTTRTGQHCTVHPGEVLIAADNTGSGHTWKLLDDSPWKRAYIGFADGTETHFQPDAITS